MQGWCCSSGVGATGCSIHLIGLCFGCGCVGAVAERYTANSSVKGAGEVRWDAVLVSISVKGKSDVSVGV